MTTLAEIEEERIAAILAELAKEMRTITEGLERVAARLRARNGRSAFAMATRDFKHCLRYVEQGHYCQRNVGHGGDCSVTPDDETRS
jgi:hypothetical protein